MSNSTSQPTKNASITLPLLTVVISVIGLFALLAFNSSLEEGEALGFLVPYKNYISVGLVALLGHMAVQAGSRWVYVVAEMRASEDVAGSMRIITRLVGYGLMFSFIASVLTDNAAAALTMGSFAGMIAGFASQTVMGNTVAGIFLAIARPIGTGENVSIGSSSGIVADITLMHIVLDADDRLILLPTAKVITSTLVKHKQSD